MADNHKALAEQDNHEGRPARSSGSPEPPTTDKPKPSASERALRMAPPNAIARGGVELRCCPVLHAPEHCDLAVAQVWSRVLDDGTYLCSQATMQRILRAAREGRDRRCQRTHPAKKIPELMARRRKRGLELGHHQVEGSGSSDLLRPSSSSSTATAATS